MTPLRDGQLSDEPILHVMWSLRIGGAERALYQLVRAQRDRGREVGVLVASDLGLYGEHLAHAGVWLESLEQRRGSQLLHARRAAPIFRRWPIVHFHVAEPGLMAIAAGTDARAFYTHRAGAFDYPISRRLRYATTGWMLRRRFTGIVGNTAHAASVASRLFRIPIRDVGVVYNGLDWELLRPERGPDSVRRELGDTRDQFVVGTSANLRDWKRIDLSLLALARSETDAVLVVVGDGPERPQLESLARDLAIEARVRFVGMRANVADYLQVLDAFVLTSGPEESFGNAAVEAMGYGLPTIVMRDGGGLVEHVDHLETGLVAEDVDDLAQWLRRLRADASLRRSLGTAARERTRTTYTVERMVDGYSRLYDSGSVDSLKAPAGAPRVVGEAG